MMIYEIVKRIHHYINVVLPTVYYSFISGLKINTTNISVGRPRIIEGNKLVRRLLKQNCGKLVIGDNFKCNNKVTSNSIGLIQPCVFNISSSGSRILIGNNVGISGSTINAATTITIGDNVMIGSGCLITDTDSHPLHWKERLEERNGLTRRAPITIEDNAFIGARSIILKGVTIGKGAVVGAGSVVSKDVPPFAIVCGNPAKVVKYIN